MNKLILAVAIAGASLSACTANQLLESTPVLGSVCDASRRTFIDEGVVISSQTLYVVSGEAYLRSVDGGLLPQGELRSRIKSGLLRMYNLQNAIRAGRGTANCDFAAMKELHSEVILLIPRK